MYVALLYVAPLEAPLDDGGGIRGRVDVSIIGNGTSWTLRFNGRHDAGTEPLSAALFNNIAPLTGPRLGDGGLSDTGLSPFSGEVALTTAELREVQEGRVYVGLPSGGVPDGFLRGQLLAPGDELGASTLRPMTGSPHPGRGGLQLVFRGLTLRYEARWSPDVAGTSAHFHSPAGATLLTLALLPDAGGLKGVASAIPLSTCQTQACYTDVHTADSGSGPLLRTW